jgi:nucleotide-binding universal stress UspA family protein
VKLERGSVLPLAELLVSSVVVGVDGSEAGYEACRQAARLAVPVSRVELVCAVDLARVVHAGFSASTIAGDLAAEGAAALDAAAEIFAGRASPELLDGGAVQALLRAIDRTAATLVVVGSHGHRRAAEVVLGGVSGELLHAAPCAVLVARATAAPELFPRTIVAGVDGSPEAERALSAAEELAARFDARLRVVTALRGKGIDPARVRTRAPFAEVVDERPVDALVAAAADAELLVVGSRGLHGLRALGSVSERVAHRAGCSVLVVRLREPR